MKIFAVFFALAVARVSIGQYLTVPQLTYRSLSVTRQFDFLGSDRLRNQLTWDIRPAESARFFRFLKIRYQNMSIWESDSSKGTMEVGRAGLGSGVAVFLKIKFL